MKAAVGGLLIGLTMAARQPLKPVIVSYWTDTPQSVVQQAMDACVRAGGKVKHVYTIINGFSADCPEEAISQVKASGVDKGVNVEDDQIVTIDK